MTVVLKAGRIIRKIEVLRKEKHLAQCSVLVYIMLSLPVLQVFYLRHFEKHFTVKSVSLKGKEYVHVIDFTLFNISFVFFWNIIFFLSFSFSTGSNLGIADENPTSYTYIFLLPHFTQLYKNILANLSGKRIK